MVYGDRELRLKPRVALDQLRKLARSDEPLDRRELATTLVIETGVIVQGLLDQLFTERHCDDLDARTIACSRVCSAAGNLLLSTLDLSVPRAWDTDRAAWLEAVEQLAKLELPAEVRAREPEGFAYYGVYPELYALAARRLRDLIESTPVQVIGIRSIGTSLAGVVHAVLKGPLAITVRPVGHPFSRSLAIGRRLAEQLAPTGTDLHYAIVDEGPGLSGSSFAAVHDWLRARGVARERISFLPSHEALPGLRGSAAFRAEYAAARRPVVTFAARFEPSLQAATDVSGGRWRDLFYGPGDERPPSNVCEERRKYVLSLGGGGKALMKLTGLGPRAEAIRSMQRELGENGFSPKQLGSLHGFTLSELRLDARPLGLARVERALMIDAVARYLAFIAARFKEPISIGAGPRALIEMVVHNARALLGPSGADQLTKLSELMPELERADAPTMTDNKLDRHEWLCLPNGTLLKTDALEHAHAHDMVGPQDPAWDVAGALIELGLTYDERENLLARLRNQARRTFSERKLRFYEIAYLAFRAGHAAQAADTLEPWPEDAARMRSASLAYIDALRSRCIAS